MAAWFCASVLAAGSALPAMTVTPAVAGSRADDPLPDAPTPQTTAATASATAPAQPNAAPHQTKRILFIVPNFRSVTADVKLPPQTPREKFKLFLEDSFDYSGFIEVAILSGMSQAQGSIPEFRSGGPAYARYYWHSFTDATDANLMTEFLVPVATREDPRYYTLGHGGFQRRAPYSISRLLITRSDHGHAMPNFSEIVGNGAAAGISNFYYPRPERTWTKTGQRWLLQVGIDGLSNFIKEFWPEVNRDLFHGKY